MPQKMPCQLTKTGEALAHKSAARPLFGEAESPVYIHSLEMDCCPLDERPFRGMADTGAGLYGYRLEAWSGVIAASPLEIKLCGCDPRSRCSHGCQENSVNRFLENVLAWCTLRLIVCCP